MVDPRHPDSLGWVGIGAMGLPMCRHLARAGHTVMAYDLLPERTACVTEFGATPALDLLHLARRCDTVFTMVYDDAALEAVIAGLEPGLRQGTTVVDLSTVSPAASARVARLLDALEVAYVRAPVSGSVGVAEAGQLSIFASGARSDFERCQPLLATFSIAQRHVGEAEAARVVKLAINLMVVNMTALVGEALAFGAANGVARDMLVDCLNDSIVGCRHTQSRAAGLKTRIYTNAGPMRLGAKDLDLALELARAQSLGLPLTAMVRQYVSELLFEGHSEIEITKLAEFPRPLHP